MRDPTELRKRAGTRGDPSADQYFLEDSRVLDRIVGYAREADFDMSRVLEIGPGTGALTARLLEAAETVHVIERDAELASFLRKEFQAEIRKDRLRLTQGDALEIDLPPFTASVSNLPYGISSEVLFRLLPRRRPLLVMVQWEFGERMAAAPGSDAYGRLSVSAQHFGTVEVVERVPPSVFQPQPPVDSAVVRVLPRPPEYDLIDETVFLDIVRAVFTQRRKTLRNALRNTVHISGIDNVEAIIDAVDADVLGRRPGELSPATFAHIANLTITTPGDGIE